MRRRQNWIFRSNDVFKSIVKPVLLAITLSALPAVASASGSLSSIGNTIGSSSNTAGFQTSEAGFTRSCSKGNFTGYVTGVIGRIQNITYVRIDSYRIVKSAGQGGGNKANVNLWSYGQWGDRSERKSPDSMKQDSQWHELKMSTSHQGYGLRSAHVEIIFDKSGSDPRCSFQI